ncbi:50S ribosomal protein L32 [Candidatus Aerophobetes bacterium]|uniref:Large ribosomal subunit protein bL32 n=1 Tax=Aerophobetes bacterium TaxID=2030807 RepID=A0A2A4YMX9_UNCAE|nr:MAG: 50S ribosomal protein L32 [Candidatus Aerophobetes bacterium]
MAVPRNRTSNARKNSRRSHHAKTPVNFAKCPNCEKARIPHRMCDSCGHYNGRAIVTKKEQ